MNRILEITAIALGGFSLFAMCFFGFATMAGVPLHEVAVLGKLFPEPESSDPVDPEEVPTVAMEDTTDTDVLASSLGVLATWSLSPPYTGTELKSLADELKLKSLQLDQRLLGADERDRELAEREEQLADHYETIEELRAKLERFEQDLLLRAEEIERDEGAAETRSANQWKKLASLFAELDPEEAKNRLSAYEPAEATKILLHLDNSEAIEILNGFEGDQYIKYAEAWAAEAAPGD